MGQRTHQAFQQDAMVVVTVFAAEVEKNLVLILICQTDISSAQATGRIKLK